MNIYSNRLSASVEPVKELTWDMELTEWFNTIEAHLDTLEIPEGVHHA